LNLFYTLLSRSSKDFELAIDNVRFFYENLLNLPRSPNHEVVKAIHLLFLLSNNRNEEFYAKLEAMEVNELDGDLISFVMKLNDAIEEGNYRRVFQLKNHNKIEYFRPFLEKVEDTIRI
jgi:protoheme ferro-lyase